MARAAHLCDGLPNIDFIMSCAYPHDVEPASRAYLESFRAMISNTTKPMVMTAEGGADLEVMWKIACELRGGEDALRAKPYFIMYGEPVSPLKHAVEVLDKLLFCADKGIPAIYSPAPSAGATAPITQAGHIVLAVAESLFGLVIHQLRKPGAPFIFGMGPVKIDMSTVQALYNSAEYYTTILGICEMAKWLDLPNWGYAGSSDSHVVDAQAGADAAELTLLSMQAGSNLNHDIGYLAFGLIGALELVVITDEIISLNRRTLEGIEVSARHAGRRRDRQGRPGRRLPAREAHRQVRPRPAVDAHDPQPQDARELEGRRRARPAREGAPQGARHPGRPQAGADRPRREGHDRRARRRPTGRWGDGDRASRYPSGGRRRGRDAARARRSRRDRPRGPRGHPSRGRCGCSPRSAASCSNPRRSPCSPPTAPPSTASACASARRSWSVPWRRRRPASR